MPVLVDVVLAQVRGKFRVRMRLKTSALVDNRKFRVRARVRVRVRVRARVARVAACLCGGRSCLLSLPVPHLPPACPLRAPIRPY